MAYIPLIQKDSVTHVHGLAVYVKEGLPLARHLSLENSVNCYYVFEWLYFIQGLTFFSHFWSPSSSLCTVLDAISSGVGEVLLMNPSANVFVIGEFNIQHRDW